MSTTPKRHPPFKYTSSHYLITFLTILSLILFLSLKYTTHHQPPPPLTTTSPPAPPLHFAYFISGTSGDGPRLTRLLTALYHSRNYYLLHLGMETGEGENSFMSVGKLGTISLFDIEGFKDMKSLPDEMLSNLTALEELQILGCPNLRCMPEGIQNLEAFKSLVIGECELLKVRCEIDVGEDWSKIANITYIKIDDQVI